MALIYPSDENWPLEKSSIISIHALNSNRSTRRRQQIALLQFILFQKMLHETGGDVSSAIFRIVHDLQMQRYCGLNTLNNHRLKGSLHSSNSQIARACVHNHLGDH